jgi:hypothetical protein
MANATRLDRFYVTEVIKMHKPGSEIKAMYFIDHVTVLLRLHIETAAPPLGRRYWKLNNLLLENTTTTTTRLEEK